MIFVTAALLVSSITADGPGGHHHGAHHGAHHAVHGAPHHAVNLGHHQQVGGVIHVGPVAQVNHPVQHAVHHQAPVTHHVTPVHHSVHGPVHGHFSVAANTVPVVPVVTKAAEVPNIAELVSTNPKFSTLLADKEKLKSVLLRHVVTGSALQGKNIPPGTTNLKTAGGEEIGVTRDKFIQIKSSAGQAYVVLFDVLASNGVVHAVDTVF